MKRIYLATIILAALCIPILAGPAKKKSMIPHRDKLEEQVFRHFEALHDSRAETTPKQLTSLVMDLVEVHFHNLAKDLSKDKS